MKCQIRSITALCLVVAVEFQERPDCRVRQLGRAVELSEKPGQLHSVVVGAHNLTDESTLFEQLTAPIKQKPGLLSPV